LRAELQQHWMQETARLTKDGHSSIARSPDGLPSTAALGREVLGLSQKCRPAVAERQQSSWRCPGGAQRRAPLYRSPLLPVYASSAPGAQGVSIQRYRDDTRDWRKLPPEDIVRLLRDLESAITQNCLRGIPAGIRTEKTHGQHSDALQQLEGLVSAVVVGTLQACHESLYWAPSTSDARSIVQVDVVRSPMSRLFVASPDISSLSPREGVTAELKVCADVNPLAACQALAGGGRRVALVRFSPAGDRRSLLPCCTDHRESQLFTQTTYAQALMDMPRHLHTDPVQALDAGGLIYTTDVSVLRGPLQDGAPWLADAPLVDVLWVALQRNPRSDDQGQYARIEEKALAASTIDRIFACAAINQADAIVFPPPGVGGAVGCRHPAEDMGDLLRKAILQHSKIMPTVHVCQEYPGQLQSAWTPFAAALENFRQPIEHRELVAMAASPYVRPGWEPKRKKGTPRCIGTPRGLGAAGRSIAC